MAKMSPLHMAVVLKNLKLLDVLLSHKADINIQDQFKNTVLHYASALSDMDILQECLTRGARISI